MKYSYIKILLLIIVIYIFYPIINKYLNLLLGIKEGFVWSRDTIKKFDVYQNTVNLNQNQFNMEVLQEQASEDEAKELMKTGYWPWSEDTKKQYVESVWQNPIIKFDPGAALIYAMKLYNSTAAKRLFPAEMLSRVYQQGMVLIVQRCILWKVLHKKRLYLFIDPVPGNNIMSFQYPAGVGINDKNRFATAIKQDAVHRLLANPIDTQQFSPECPQLFIEHFPHLAGIFFLQETEERLESFCFYIVIS